MERAGDVAQSHILGFNLWLKQKKETLTKYILSILTSTST